MSKKRSVQVLTGDAAAAAESQDLLSTRPRSQAGLNDRLGTIFKYQPTTNKQICQRVARLKAEYKAASPSIQRKCATKYQQLLINFPDNGVRNNNNDNKHTT